MFDLDVTISIIDMERSFAEGLRTLDNELSGAVARAVAAGAEEAHDHHTYQNQTGRLEGNTKGRMVERYLGEIVADTHYAEYVERHQRVGGFMARAERVANAVLEVEVERAVERAEAAISR